MQFSHIIGIDEVGRGPLAGPTAVCAFGARKGFEKVARAYARATGIPLRDSKKLTALHRELWFAQIKLWQKAGDCDFAVTMIHAKAIDRVGIAVAIKKALRMSLAKLACDPAKTSVLLDGGLRAPAEYVFQKTIIKGDEKEIFISLASIAAKVTRDRHMHRLAQKHPEYGFEKHVGYGTRAHYEAIRKHGTLAVHRQSFLRKMQTTK